MINGGDDDDDESRLARDPSSSTEQNADMLGYA